MLISYIKGLLASSWLGKLMPLINIPSKSARRGTREPELHSVKGEGGEEARETLSGQLCHRFPAEIKHGQARTEGNFAFCACVLPRRGTRREYPSREGSWIATSVLPILISAYSHWACKAARMFKREENARGKENPARLSKAGSSRVNRINTSERKRWRKIISI